MKKILLFLFTLTVSASALFANPKHEFRASWMTTGFSIDWPKQKTAEGQQAELKQKLDALVAGNHNAVCLQVRSFSDAIYKSSYEPWAECLTGTRGQDPGYDPLAFAIEEAHKRGLELHVWVNPFRVTSAGKLSEDDPVWKNAGQWIIKYNNSSFSGQIIDPGYPEARDYVHKVFMEIVNNYDIDGILMDDYFYAYGGTNTEDADSKNKYCFTWKNGQSKPSKDGDNDYTDDWRRANVDSVVHRLYRDLQKTKPWVRFGMGTPGSWTNRGAAASYYGISLPSGISAMESYDYLYCNPVEWAQKGWVDYLNPQIYWSTKIAKTDYDVLCKWWAKTVCENFSNKLPNGQKVHFFASQGACYAVDPSSMPGYDDGVKEIQAQIDANRANLSSGYTGSVFFSTSDAIILRNDLRESHFQYKALPPAMDWKSKTTLTAPTNIKVKDTIMTWEHPTAERFTIYVYPRGTKFAPEKVAATAAATVPTQEELWASFNAAAGFGLGKLSSISTINTIAGKATADNLNSVFAKAEWKWLKTYIQKIQNAQQGTVIVGQDGTSRNVPQLTETINADNAVFWRYSVGAFFLQTQYTGYPATADFTTAGKPSAWGPSYLGEDTGSGDNSGTTTSNTPAPEYLKKVVYGKTCRMDGWGDLGTQTVAIYAYDRYGVEHAAAYYEGNEVYEPKVVIKWELDGGKVDVDLPTYVTERYVLPIPVKYGYNFDCWRNVKTTRGQKLTEIPAGWEGTLYAFWKKWPTDVTNIIWNGQVQVYDIMGRFVGNELPTDQHGVFIIIQGENQAKIIL